MSKFIFNIDIWTTKKCEKCGKIYPIAGGCECKRSEYIGMIKRKIFDELKQNEIRRENTWYTK